MTTSSPVSAEAAPDIALDGATGGALSEIVAAKGNTGSPDGGSALGLEQSDLDEADDVGENYTESFTPAALEEGEILIAINELKEWEHHLRRYSPLRSSHGAALALSAAEPLSFEPITVLKKDDQYLVVDGRYRVAAIEAQYPDDKKIKVRAKIFNGTEAEAVQHMCDNALGRIPATKMEMAHGLLALQRAANISQTKIAERFPALTKDKVSRQLMAARLQDAYPVLFQILEQPHLATIEHAVSLSRSIKGMAPNDLAAMLDRAKELDSNGERLAPDDLFDALGIERVERQARRAAGGKKPLATLSSEPIFGDDDVVIGAYERLLDDADRIRLPAVDDMTPSQREAAAAACIASIYRHFGLEK